MNNIVRPGHGGFYKADGMTGTSMAIPPPLLGCSTLPLARIPEPLFIAERASSAGGLAAQWPASESSLNLALVYEDARTRRWTQRVTRSLLQTLGRHSVCSNEWKLGDFAQTSALSKAVVAAITADVIVIALYAAEELPWELCLWVEAWLPRRLQTRATLVGLMGVSAGSESRCCQTEDYLSAVAVRGGLETFIHRCELSLEDFAADVETPGNGEAATVSVDHYEHWGLNE